MDFLFQKCNFSVIFFYDSVNFPLYKLINLLFGNSRSAFHNTQQSKKNANSNKETLHCSHVWFSTVKNCNDLISGLYLSPQASQHSMISYLSHVNTLIILQYNLIDVQCGITLYYPEILSQCMILIYIHVFSSMNYAWCLYEESVLDPRNHETKVLRKFIIFIIII